METQIWATRTLVSSEKQGLECVGGSMPSIDETVSVDLGERECGVTMYWRLS